MPSQRVVYNHLNQMGCSTAAARRKDQKQARLAGLQAPSTNNDALQKQVQLNLTASAPARTVYTTSIDDYSPSGAKNTPVESVAMPYGFSSPASVTGGQHAESTASIGDRGHQHGPYAPSSAPMTSPDHTGGMPIFQQLPSNNPALLQAQQPIAATVVSSAHFNPTSTSFHQPTYGIDPDLETMMSTDMHGVPLQVPSPAITTTSTDHISPSSGRTGLYTFYCDSQPQTSAQMPVSQRHRAPDMRNRAPINRSILQLRTEYIRPSSNRNSAATDDSGYVSGRGSPFGFVSETFHSDPQSLTEFGGLHRVPCHCLHEPQAPQQQLDHAQPHYIYKDIKETCHVCRYGGIHNLSWSAQYLKFEVFEAELKLKLDPLYDLQAIDMAGNSGLHYAAAGGAGPRCLNALINAGLDPYLLNTAGQLFLHCWTLHPPDNDNRSSQTLDDVLFQPELVNLLNRMNSRGTAASKWRDNDGYIPFDVRKPITQDPKLDEHIRR